MKVFFVLNSPSPRNEDAISLIFALLRVDSIGFASDLLEALEMIRQRCPNAPIFDSNVSAEKYEELLILLLNIEHSIIVLPKNYSTRDKCIYVGGDVCFNKRIDFDSIVKAMGQVLRELPCENDRSCVVA